MRIQKLYFLSSPIHHYRSLPNYDGFCFGELWKYVKGPFDILKYQISSTHLIFRSVLKSINKMVQFKLETEYITQYLCFPYVLFSNSKLSCNQSFIQSTEWMIHYVAFYVEHFKSNLWCLMTVTMLH